MKVTDVLFVAHTSKRSNIDTIAQAAGMLLHAGIKVRMLTPTDPPSDDILNHPILGKLPHTGHGPTAAVGADLILVLGGDGTFLRAADIAHSVDLPVLGINLGHVGFLAEWESDSLELAITRVIEGDFRVTDRMTLDVTVIGPDNTIVGTGWALNEVSVENINRRGVLDATLEVDRHPVSTFGCDGVLISSPTGSTAYAFSAGGPVLWPELDAILVVPNNAHALFAKPLVVSPYSMVAVESNSQTSSAVAVMDGFRAIAMPPGARVEVTSGKRPVRWVRLDEATFTDRLVRKFRLPVSGWRGSPSTNTTPVAEDCRRNQLPQVRTPESAHNDVFMAHRAPVENNTDCGA